MRLHRLTVTAFGPFGGTQTVDFDALSSAGLFLLHGATGSGKTSVLDAVCFALYGRVPGNREKFTTTLRSDHADPHTPTEVVLDVTVQDRRLEITRRPEQRRPKRRGSGLTTDKAFAALRMYHPATGTWKPLSRSHQEIGEEIGQLLGMSREQFCQVVLLPQGDFARFLRADAEARGRLLGHLFDTRRFADAEQCLAERRRTLSERVRSADAGLLRLAHRMSQAAVDHTADDREREDNPLPEPEPGDPALAADILRWAAVARCSARERLASASAAAAEAKAAYAAARQAAAEARELAERRQRLADARRRAAGLEAQRAEIDRLRTRLERAQAADTVAPALDLRQAAEREYRAAAEGEQCARAQLREVCPGEVVGGAAELAARERTCRAELATLDAVRRAEERVAHLDAERRTLDREAGQDEELLQDTGAWLASWEHERDRLQRAVDTAQASAARAGELGAKLDAARRRLDAARRRESLTREIETAEEQSRRAEQRAAEAQRHWLDLRERRLDGMAAELAAALVDGERCAVCGATDHPAPARPDAGHVDRAAEEKALADHRDAERGRAEAAQQVQRLHAALESAVAESAVGSLDELAAAAERLQREYDGARDAAGQVMAAREALARAEREYRDRLSGQRAVEQRVAARASRREALLAERDRLRQSISEQCDDFAAAADRAGRLERQAELLAAAAEAVRAAESAAQRVKEADARAADAAFRARFDTPQAAAEAVLDKARRSALQDRLDRHRAEEAAVAAELSDRQLLAAAEEPDRDPDTAERAADAANDRWRRTAATESAARTRCAELDRLSAEAAADARRLAPVREAYELVARIASLAAGTSTENERRMRLESYVLAARLEQVAAAASARLARMSSGRYTLVHSADRAGRGRHGLGLHVVDAWTGRERDTATLSGGETFFASLALALGLADVVTEESGGVRLDTLFVDEGFGSLDEHSLDEVLDVLDSLRDRDRCVGIVSHVADLRQRIPAQLEVTKSRHGSALRHHCAPTPG